jgi:hypothetical protein
MTVSGRRLPSNRSRFEVDPNRPFKFADTNVGYGLRYCVGDSEVMNVVEWTSTKLPDGSQSAILWKFDGDGQITEEWWFVDTEQWKAAF